MKEVGNIFNVTHATKSAYNAFTFAGSPAEASKKGGGLLPARIK
jgi:hypothetical protein